MEVQAVSSAAPTVAQSLSASESASLVRPASLSHKRRAGLPLLVLARNPLRPAKATATVFQIQPKYMTSVMRIKMAPSLSGGPSLCAEESV